MATDGQNLDDAEKKIVNEFCHHLEKSKQLFNGLRYLLSLLINVLSLLSKSMSFRAIDNEIMMKTMMMMVVNKKHTCSTRQRAEHVMPICKHRSTRQHRTTRD